MNAQLYLGRHTLSALLAVTVLVLAALPARVQAQITPMPQPMTGLFAAQSSTGSTGGKHVLANIKEDGTATFAFFDLEEGLSNVYTGTWLYDPYGTMTLVLEMKPDESCGLETDIDTITLLPGETGQTLTAVHYPKCIWGDGGLTLLRVSEDQQAAIETAYAEAGLLPGVVFQTEVIEADGGSERQYTLNLGAAEHAMMITDSKDGEDLLTELGQWTATVYSVTVTLTGTVDTLYDEPEALAFGFVKDGSRSIAAYDFDREKYGKQGLTMTYQPQLPTLAAQAEAEPEGDVAGVYNSDVLRAADTPGLVQTLALFDTGKAQNTYNYLNGEAPTVEFGVWEDNQDRTITLVIDSALDADYTEPVTTTLTVSGQQLQTEDTVLNKLPAVEPGSSESATSK